jgi:signal transduction histidine kinase
MNSMLQSLEDAYRRVEYANETQRRFLADVSHELRTPLTVMLSSLDVLSRVGRDDLDFQAKALASIREEAERMARMVNQLLMMARTDVDADTARRPVLLVDIVADVCRQREQATRGATLEWEGIERLEGAVVEGDADYLKQLFLILLDNAHKYTPVDGTIRLDGNVEDGEARVVVSDSGPGIEPEDLPRIFDRFYRGSSADSTDGSGLGLSIAQRIAEQHGGHIDADSEPHRGSRFTVTLPLYGS